MQFSKTAAVLAGLVIVLSGCSSTPMTKPDPVNTTESAAPAKAASAAQSGATGSPQTTAANIPPYLDPNSALSTKRSIYFDFDNFSIKKEFESLLELHGKYLAKNPSLAIKIEGNSDERGGSEYNLALGQKRAETVAKALKVYGVKSTQIEAISLGEEKPKAAGHDEAAWAENRRADLVYPKQ